MLVVDASAVLHAASTRDGWDRLITIGELVAPPIMWSEAVSVLHEGIWRSAASRELTDAVLARVLEAPIERKCPETLYVEAWSIATRLSWAKTYDAEYVALALLTDCPLLTVDARLRRGAGHVIAIVGPAEL